MPRKADILFLKLAVKNRILTEDTARGVVDFLDRSERSGHPSKARYVCVERGLLDERTAKQLKRHVKEYLEKQAEVSTNGRQIGNYFVEQKLGAGAMGIVYKARHVKLGRPVALKLLLPEFAQDDVYIERFEREARAAAQLNHPNIVQCFDAGQEDDLVYIAMEFVDGKNLKDLVGEKGGLAEQEAVKVVIQVARALEHAAAAGLIHRDVKPANIMLTRDGTAKLLDLGLAKKIENQENSELTGVGHAIGTPYYMAPEQALEEQVDHRADIYALGCTLYCAVVGEPPYKAATPTGVLAKHLNDPIPSVRAKVKEASLGLDRVLQKMLAKKPDQRYQKHDTLVRDLEDVLAGLMPDVKSEAPTSKPVVGVTEGPRQKHQRTSLATASGSRNKGIGRPKGVGSGLSYAVGGLAACGAIVVFLGTQRPSKGNTVADGKPTASSSPRPGTGDDPNPLLPPDDPKDPKKTPDANATPLPENKQARETAAKRQLEQINKGNARGWELWRLLDTHARQWAATRAGEESRAAADNLSQTLDGNELGDLQTQSAPLEDQATAGDLLGAATGYRKLAESMHGERTIARCKERAGTLEGQAQELAAKADQDAKALADGGKEADAAQVLELSLKVRKDQKPVRDRIDDLRRRAKARESDALTLAQEKDRTAIQNLEVELRKDVRARKLDRAAAACTEALAQLTTAPARDRATAHQSNVGQLAELEKLAVGAFAQTKGQTVALGKTEGTIKGAGPNGVTVEINQHASATVPWTEIDEKTLVRQVRKAKAADDAQCNRFLALAKVYRGDDDAGQAAAKEGLIEVLKQLDSSNGVGAVARVDPQDVASPPPVASSPTPKPGPQPSPVSASPPPAVLPGSKSERDNFIRDNLDKIFAGATRAYYSEQGFTAFYDFGIPNRTFNGLWKLEGEANPTPAGRTERWGLILASNEGRAVYDVPFMGVTSLLEVRFMSFSTLKDDSRLTLVLTDTKKGDRYASNFGALVVTQKGKKAKAMPAPDDLAARITTNVQHRFQILFKDGKVSTRLDDQETSSVSGIGIGEQKFSIEWVDTNVNVQGIDVIGYPTSEYVQKATGAAPPK